MADMLVKLFCFEPDRALYQSLEEQGISLRRAMAPDKSRIVRWVDEHFGMGERVRRCVFPPSRDGVCRRAGGAIAGLCLL